MATRIHCPVCAWPPGPHDRWICSPGCATVWNTFETRARCPGCSKQWRTTACLACALPSPHDDWYHDDTEAPADEDAHEETLVGTPSETRPGAAP